MKKLFFLITLLITYDVFAESYEEKVARSKALIGKPVQQHLFYTKDKNEISFDALEGKPSIAYFFASWCAPCYPTLENLGKAIESASPSVNIIAVSFDEDWSMLEKMLEKTNFSGTVWKASEPRASLQYKMFGNFTGSLPYIIRLDENGTLVEVGWHIKTPEEWAAALTGKFTLAEASRL